MTSIWKITYYPMYIGHYIYGLFLEHHKINNNYWYTFQSYFITIYFYILYLRYVIIFLYYL